MNDRRSVTKKLLRFFEIDLRYLELPIIRSNKVADVIKTDISLILNLLFRRMIISHLSIGSINLYYDTVFTTKTFLDTCYDFFIETQKLSILPKNPVIIDVGANVGQFLFSVKSFFPNASVYSFEPDPNIYPILEMNAKEYSKTKTYRVALSNKSGKGAFFRDADFSVWSTLVQPGSGKKFTKIEVDKAAGDTYFKELKSIVLIKIDVEGAELEVLRGMKATIKKTKYLLVEASLSRESSDDGSSHLLGYIFKNGFNLYSVGRIFQNGKGEKQGAVDLLFKNANIK